MSFSKQVVTGASAEGEYIYYNATVINNTIATNQQGDDPNLYFQDTRTNPIIKDTSKYVVSVDNFTINGAQKNLPVFIPEIVPGSDINLTIYTVTFGAACSTGTGVGTAATTYIQATIPITWIPENQALWVPVPTTASPRQVETPYYYCYTYDHWVALMNNALAAAWRDVKFKATERGLVMGTQCPYFTFDQNTGLFSINQDAQTSWLPFGTPAQGDGAVSSATQGVSDALAPYIPFGASTASGYSKSEFSYVGWNTNLDLLISNLDTVYFGNISTPVPGATAGFSYVASSSTVLAPNAVTWSSAGQVYYPENVVNVIPKQDRYGSNVFTLGTPYSAPTNSPTTVYISNTQDFISTGSVWSPVASIVLVTATIPVRFENNAAPVVLGSANNGGTSGVSGASQKVLLETPIDAVTADTWRGFIQYKPLTPIFSALDPCHDGLSTVDVSWFWRNRLTNSLIPLQNVNTGSVSFRLRFVKK
jgi:hypothetical protein